MNPQKLRNPLFDRLTSKQGILDKMKHRTSRTVLSTTRPGLDFIPVRVSDPIEPITGEDRIEIRFPSGLEVILSGSSALTMAETLISKR